MALAAAMLCAPAANAQKVNESAILQKLQKSDADIQDAKKNVKASTWLNRAKVYFESIQEPTKNLFPGLHQMELQMAVGEPLEKTETEWIYPWVKVSFLPGGGIAWVQTKEVKEGAIDTVFEALDKAYQLDPKSASKIKSQLQAIEKFYVDQAGISYEVQRYDIAQKGYELAYRAQSHPAYNQPNDEYLFYSGQLATFLGSEQPEMFAKGEQLLSQAIANGYTDEACEIYYYLFHCYYGQREKDHGYIIKGKDALLEGIAKNPKNERILDGLMQLYTSEEGVGDPADLIALIDKALEDDPQNADLWFGRGRVFYKIGDIDECIKSFHKVVEIKPDLFEGNYFLAIFYMSKGDNLRNEVNSRDYKSQSEYDAEWQKVLEIYKLAVPWFERSLEIDPTHVDTVDCLKAMCARLRDEGPEYAEKFTKYTTMYNEMKGM